MTYVDQEMGRDIVFKALTGSHNYNLQTVGSDKDYKIFVAPTFEDMYGSKPYSKSIITATEDKDIHDIRKFPELMWKSNIAFMEAMHSISITFFDTHHDAVQELISLADDIATINLPQLFKSSGGMYLNRLKRLNHATEGTQHLVDAHGWNTKEGMHTFRTLDLIIRFADTDFKDFRKALEYTDNEKAFLLAIKNGDFTQQDFIELVTYIHDNRFAPLKDKYCSQKPNEELKLHLDNLVKGIVKDSMAKELSKSIASKFVF